MPNARRRIQGDVVIDRLEITDDFKINGRTVPSLLQRGQTYCVDTTNGTDTNGGHNWDDAFQTMGAALAVAASYDTILFSGDVREELIGSPLVFDVTIVGMGTRPRHANTGYAGASVWRPPASPTTATPLLKVRAQGWSFHNILFDCPVDAAGIYLERNAIDGVASGEYDASHAGFYNCRFESGFVGIQNTGGCGFVEVENCRFYRMTGSNAAGIKCTNTGTAVPLNWQIRDCHFADNASHILSSMSYSEIVDNIFGKFTATLSVDLYNQPSAGQGEYNVITRNYFTGTFNAATYPAGSNNEWAGNTSVAGATTSDPA